jgi:hypothetical protein
MTSTMQTCSIQGNGRLNEDARIVNEADRVYGVVDGATSLTDYRDAQGRTGGYIAAHLLASRMGGFSADQSLREIAVEANTALRESMLGAGVDVTDVKQPWSAAFVVFRIRDTFIEYVQAGDCMLFARYADGTYRQLTYDQIASADRILLQKRREAAGRGITDPAEARAYTLPTLCANRAKANTLDGYSVLNGDVRFGDYVESGRFSRARVERLYAVTDGLFHSLEAEDPGAVWTQMLQGIDSRGLEAYAADLVRMEEEDTDCSRYPRLKVADDKTGLVLDL